MRVAAVDVYVLHSSTLGTNDTHLSMVEPLLDTRRGSIIGVHRTNYRHSFLWLCYALRTKRRIPSFVLNSLCSRS